MNELTLNYNGSGTEQIYAVVRRPSDGKVWNGIDLVDWDDLDIEDYDLQMAFLGGDLWAVSMPAVAAGLYRVFFYIQTGSAASIDDNRLDSREVYWNGSSASPPPEVGAPSSPYHTFQEFKDRFGLKNITRASNKDADGGGPNLNAIQAAFNYAQLEVEDYMRPIYQIPLVFDGGIVPERVKRWAMNIAYGDLYEVRGWQDSPSAATSIAGRAVPGVGNKITRLLRETYQEMAQYRGSFPGKVISAARRSDVDVEVTPLYAPGDGGLIGTGMIEPGLRYPDEVPRFGRSAR